MTTTLPAFTPDVRRVIPALIAAALLGTPAALTAQNWVPHIKQPAGRAVSPGALRLRPPWQVRRAGPTRAMTATVTEAEPNDSLSLANPVSPSDVATGVINPGWDSTHAADVDYYAIDLPVGTTVNLDVDAACCGSLLDPVLALFDSVGGQLAFNDDYDGLDSRIVYTIQVTGHYYVAIAGFGGQGCPGCTYSLYFGSLVPGPGDPTTLFVTGLDGAFGFAAGAHGELYVANGNAYHVVYRVSPAGIITTLWVPGAAASMVVDGFGNLLTAGMDSTFTRGVVWRITPAGQVTVFKDSLPAASAITVGPDGDVWVLDPVSPALWRLDPLGALKTSISLAGSGINGYFDEDLKFSPSGVLHFTNSYAAVFTVVGSSFQQVITTASYIEGLAFDVDGYLYVSNGYLGTVQLYDPSYQLVGGDVFARTNLGGPTFLAFSRGAGGAMTSRLFADNNGYNLAPPYIGSIVEMNPAGMRAPGFRVGVDLLVIVNNTVRPGVVGADYADTLRVADPPGALTWTVESGALPAGLSLDGVSGAITGTPRDSGTFLFTVRAQGSTRFGLQAFILRVTNPTVGVTVAASHLLGGDSLSTALRRFLDLQGNRNGRYDIGDFRAYLRARGQLPAAVVRKEQP